MKFNENRSKGSGGMEHMRNSRINPMTLNYDIDIESSWVLLIVSLVLTFG